METSGQGKENRGQRSCLLTAQIALIATAVKIVLVV